MPISRIFFMTPKASVLTGTAGAIWNTTIKLRHQLPFRYCASPAHWQLVDDNTCVPYARTVAVAPLELLGRVTWEVMASLSLFARTGGGITGPLRGRTCRR